MRPGSTEPEESLKFIRNKYPQLKVLLTLGEKGSVFTDGIQEIYQSAFEVTAKDTTAAGDTFMGYFVAEYSRGTEYSQILKIASAASAIAVSRKGAAPSIPDRCEVLSSMSNMKEKNSNSKEKQVLELIDTYIDENIKTANITELSQILGYSTIYTGNLVKKLTGDVFSKRVLSKRCKIAADMLSDTELSIYEIIHTVGYENESFFRKAFKDKYGKTPLEFRKKGVK